VFEDVQALGKRTVLERG